MSAEEHQFQAVMFIARLQTRAVIGEAVEQLAAKQMLAGAVGVLHAGMGGEDFAAVMRECDLDELAVGELLQMAGAEDCL